MVTLSNIALIDTQLSDPHEELRIDMPDVHGQEVKEIVTNLVVQAIDLDGPHVIAGAPSVRESLIFGHGPCSMMCYL